VQDPLLFESARLRDAALSEIRSLAEQTAVAADVARKALRHERNQKRPKVPADEYRRLADRFRHLDSKGISLDHSAAEVASGPPLPC
jgi:hypothetical protein